MESTSFYSYGTDVYKKMLRRNQIEKTMTQPDDAIDEALANMEWLEEE